MAARVKTEVSRPAAMANTAADVPLARVPNGVKSGAQS